MVENLIKIIIKILSEKHQKLFHKTVFAESITLLKNDNNILPLKKEQSILLIGPATNDLNILNGAWTHMAGY